MRVGIIAPPWVPVPPPMYGGTEQVIDGLARGFLAAGHEVLLWTTGDSTCPVPRAGILPEAPGITGLVTTELHHAIQGHRALAEWGADVIHDHSLTGPVVARTIHDIPTLTTLHGSFDAPACSLYSTVAQHVRLIAISRDQASHAGGITIEAVIHHGIDMSAFTEGPGTGDEHGLYLAFLGRMAPEKGVHLAARAARETGQRLLIAAKMREEPEHEYFRTQVRPLLGDGVEYLGEVDHEGRVELLQGATALVNPIQWDEPFGLVMVEALACGTPVISSDNPGGVELHGLFGDDVAVVPREDPTRLADAVIAALSKPRRAGRATADTLEREFRPKAVAANYYAIYRTVLSRAGRRDG